MGGEDHLSVSLEHGDFTGTAHHFCYIFQICPHRNFYAGRGGPSDGGPEYGDFGEKGICHELVHCRGGFFHWGHPGRQHRRSRGGAQVTLGSKYCRPSSLVGWTAFWEPSSAVWLSACWNFCRPDTWIPTFRPLTKSFPFIGAGVGFNDQALWVVWYRGDRKSLIECGMRNSWSVKLATDTHRRTRTFFLY